MNKKKINESKIKITDPKGKEEALKQHCQEIFKIQQEDNINFDQENKQTVELNIN